jgi:rod shape determining protein RodA
MVLLLSLLILDISSHTDDANRWLMIGGIHLQPAEFMKPVLVLTLARFMSDKQRSPKQIKNVLLVFGLAFIPFILVIKQPDLGTALCFMVVTLPMLYWWGLSTFAIFIIVAPFITFIASFNFWSFFFVILMTSFVLYVSQRKMSVFWTVFTINILVGIVAPQVWGHLHAYQQQRILTFLGLVSDPQGAGYQIIQSKVAIGSGGLLGKGFMQGTQTQLRFLPAQHTDFIFSVLAEEWGFIGSAVVILAFFLLIIKSINIASANKNRFTSLVVIGLAAIFMFQIVVNIGMTVGVMPVTGLPLPLISYGGSSMITSLMMIGIIAKASRDRFRHF